MATTLLMLPPQTPKTRAWASRLHEAVPALTVVVAETEADAARAIGEADAAFGTMPDALLGKAARLRWLQAPQAAPPAGYYTPALIAHPVVVTNFREIYNDLIGAHIMAFVLAFARGFHHYFPRQVRREWRPEQREESGVVHLPDATALIVGVGGIGSEAARLMAAFGMHVMGVDARRREAPIARRQPPDRLGQPLPGGRHPALSLLALHEVEQRARCGVEPLTLGKARASRRVVLALEGAPAFAEQRLGGDRVATGRSTRPCRYCQKPQPASDRDVRQWADGTLLNEGPRFGDKQRGR
jgi:hypothetical protein